MPRWFAAHPFAPIVTSKEAPRPSGASSSPSEERHVPRNAARMSGEGGKIHHFLFRRRGSPPRTMKVSEGKSSYEREKEDAKLVDNLPPIPPPEKRPIP